jgi:hypothetical protein
MMKGNQRTLVCRLLIYAKRKSVDHEITLEVVFFFFSCVLGAAAKRVKISGDGEADDINGTWGGRRNT